MVEKSEFKGRPVIKLKRDEKDEFGFTFGLTKAKLIIENLEEIKQFIKEHENE